MPRRSLTAIACIALIGCALWFANREQPARPAPEPDRKAAAGQPPPPDFDKVTFREVAAPPPATPGTPDAPQDSPKDAPPGDGTPLERYLAGDGPLPEPEPTGDGGFDMLLDTIRRFRSDREYRGRVLREVRPKGVASNPKYNPQGKELSAEDRYQLRRLIDDWSLQVASLKMDGLVAQSRGTLANAADPKRSRVLPVDEYNAMTIQQHEEIYAELAGGDSDLLRTCGPGPRLHTARMIVVTPESCPECWRLFEQRVKTEEARDRDIRQFFANLPD